MDRCKSLTEYTKALQATSLKSSRQKIKVSPQNNQTLLSAHSSFGFYLTLTIQYSGYYHMFTTQKGVFFYFSVCKEGFKMCILNTAVELSAFYMTY